uniref:Ig-like domain-containing protein n=1 Tax=Leptobrachium leishanense TaxID=445787 RepID=A0A8C5WLD1_9ANUR
MRSHRVPIGQSTRFILNVQSKPTGDVKWYHNGVEIQESSKYHITNVSGVLTLEIVHCHSEDSGTYRAVCTNYKGETSDYATLDIAGDDYYTYTPKRKDDIVPRSAFPELIKTEDYAVSSFKKTSELEASSERREVRSQVTASRESRESLEYYASEEKRVSAAEARAVEERVVHRKFKTSEPAKILTRPQSLTVSEGDNARFSCDFDGEPTPSVTWFLEGQPIVSSLRHQVTSTKYKSSFEILSVKHSDEGNYTVIVENSEGKQEAHFSLTIKKAKTSEKSIAPPTRVKSPEPHKKSHDAIKSPRRVKSPEPVTTKGKPSGKSPADKVQLPTVSAPKISQNLKAAASADKVKLSCIVESTLLNGREVAWLKDGKKLKEDGHFSFHYSADGTYELTILNISSADQGEYICEITGEGGVSRTTLQFVGQVFKSVFSQVTSVIEAKKSAQLAQSVVHEEITKTDLVSQEIKSVQTEVKKSVSHISFSEGQKVSLKADILGASQVKWMLNGSELKNSEEYRYGVSGSDQTLTIKNISAKNQGILTCEAKTDQGIIKCQFDLTLSKDQSNAPSFVYQPKSQTVNEGQDVVFKCEITGDPSPEVEWFKDNVLISVSSHIKVSRSKNVYTLEIQSAKERDTGKYTVSAKNYHGQSSATASLNVLHLVEEPTRQLVLKAADETSLQESFAAQSLQMSASRIQEASFSSSSSSSISESKFSSMSSMSSMKEASFMEMSSSSIMEKSSMRQMESLSSKMISAGIKGSSPKIEALPSDVSIDVGKVLTVACAFSGEPTPDASWAQAGQPVPSKEQKGRVHIETDEDLTTLTIMDVQKRDSGLYTLTLSNIFGTDSASVKISVRSP